MVVHCPQVPDEIARAVILPTSYADLEGTVLPACAWLRQNMPVGWAEVEGYDPIWLITRHAHIKEVVKDLELFHSADRNFMLQPRAGDEYLRSVLHGTTHVLRNITCREPPEHGNYRMATASLFQRNHVRRYEDMVREVAREHVDRFMERAGEPVDLVAELSRDYPLDVIMRMLGVPPQDYSVMLKLTQNSFGGDDPDWRYETVELGHESMARSYLSSIQEVVAYFEVVRKDRLANPRDDLASALVHSRLKDGELMAGEDQNAYLASVAIGGHDTTNSAIGAGMLGLARFPDQLHKVKADPDLIPGLVEESLRYATPARHFARNVTRDIEFHGVEMAAMDRLMCLFISGNRDEDVFPNPDDFDVTRRPNPQLAFGFGPRVCLGQHIAKLDMRILFEELIPRLGSMGLTGQPELKVSNFIGGLKTLPVTFTARQPPSG